MNIDKQRAKVDFHDTKERIIRRLEKLPFNLINAHLLSNIRFSMSMREDMVERRLTDYLKKEVENE